VDHIQGQDIDLLVPGRSVESAEGAECVAGDRVVDVAIDDVSHDLVRVKAPAYSGGESSEGQDIGMLVEMERFIGGDALCVEDFLEDRFEHRGSRFPEERSYRRLTRL